MKSRQGGGLDNMPGKAGRREFLKGASISTAVVVAPGFPRPALAQGLTKWRMGTTWPKNFPGLGSGANILAKLIGEASAGKLTIEVYGGGEIVPAFETMDAVAGDTLEMGHGAPYYWKNKLPAMQFIASMPFGMTAMEQNAWIDFGGGQELADKAYGQLGCKFFASGNTGVQAGGWFNTEIRSMDDYNGLKMRIRGLGGAVVEAAGGTVVNLPGGEILPALQTGAINATEWFGPDNDLAFGLYKSAKFYCYPGWQKPSTLLDNFINMKAWEALDSELKAIVAMANAKTNHLVLSEFVANNSAALQTLRREHGVILKRLPDPVLNGLGGLSGQVLRDLGAQDPFSQEVMNSILAFRARAIPHASFAEQAFYNARALPFSYVR